MGDKHFTFVCVVTVVMRGFLSLGDGWGIHDGEACGWLEEERSVGAR